MTPGSGGPPTKKELEKMIRICDYGGYPFYGNSGSVGRIARHALELLEALERDEKRRATLESCARILDSIVGMLTGMALQGGMPPQAVTLFNNARTSLQDLTPAPGDK